jgi:murein DD-endopeptidase MepM/ murein hydrolase activator NlpD
LTTSSDFPTTPEAFDTSYSGNRDAFVVKLNAVGSGLTYATFLGGSDEDWGYGIAVDASGAAYVTGETDSSDFPTTPRAFDTGYNGNADAFVVKLNVAGSGLAYATFLGGSGVEDGYGIAVDASGAAYVTGCSGDAFVAKLAIGGAFLDLPVSYSNFAQAALGNVGGNGPGRVNSWFDHTYPNYTENNNLTRWDGRVFTFTMSSPSRIGESWYDGHNGIDFQRHSTNEQVFAAAPGTVTEVCRNYPCSRGGSYGNYVLIDHGNGYATFYAHLKSVNGGVVQGAEIADPKSQPLGIMGGTGGHPIHLHFGVYYDQNDDGQWTEDEVVDPYGWSGSGSDP